MASLIHKTAHGMVANQAFKFANVEPEDGSTGVFEDQVYYVLATGLTANDFQFSDTLAGVAITLTADITYADILNPDVYTLVADGVMDPPTPISAPTGVTATSNTQLDADGKVVVRLIVTFTPPTDSADRNRGIKVQVTFKNDNDPQNPQPVWDSDSTIYDVPNDGTNTLAIPGVAGNTPYWVRAWAIDVYGNEGTKSTPISHTTLRDPDPPSVPGGLATQPAVKGLFVTWSPTTAKDLAFYELRYAPDDGTGLAPDRALWVVLRVKTTTVYIGNLTADTNGDGIADKKYWCQVRSVDASGNVGAWSGDVTGVASTDLITTAVPHGLFTDQVIRFPTLTGGAGLTTNTSYFVIASGLTATTFKVSLTQGGAAIDFTTDIIAPSSVTYYPLTSDYLTSSEAGYSAPVQGLPALAGATDIGAASISTVHVAGLDASVIKTGDLRISTTDANMADGIKVYNPSGVLVGLWNETGLYVYSGTDANDYVRIHNAGVSVFDNGVEVAAMNPQGINASALTFGALPGGHNVVLNSGFEIAGFGTAAALATWTVTADWSGTVVSETNITEGGTALTMTGTAF